MPVPDSAHHYDREQPLDPPKIETDEMFDNDPERDRRLPRRRLVRERVMQMLYAHELSGRDMDELFFDLAQQSLSEDDAALEFAKDLTRALTLHRPEIDELLRARLAHWAYGRLALIDRLLIEIGISELLFFPEIPPKATINELIEIAKDYSTAESGKFINGLLHAVLTELKENGRLNKTGRGLIDKSFNNKS